MQTEEYRPNGPPAGLISRVPKTVAALCLLGVLGSIAHYLQDTPYNPHFQLVPGAVHAHVVLGAIFLLLLPLQFFSKLRSNGVHRNTGRVLVAIGLVVGATALVITLVMPYSGNSERIIITPFACLFLYSIAAGFVAVRRRDFLRHQRWMIRAVAIGTAIATMRLVFIPSLIWLASPRLPPETLSIASFTFAFVLHSAFAEWWIRHRAPVV